MDDAIKFIVLALLSFWLIVSLLAFVGIKAETPEGTYGLECSVAYPAIDLEAIESDPDYATGKIPNNY